MVQKCPTCFQSVYAAEELVAGNKRYHVACFQCFACHKTLPSVATSAEHSGDYFCQPCYNAQFGPKGFGIGNASVYTGQSVASASSSSSSSCASCGAKNQTGKFCGECGKVVAGNNVTSAISSTPAAVAPAFSSASPSITAAKQAFSGNSTSSSSSAFASSSSAAKLAFGGGDVCHACNKRVYTAEAVKAAGHVFHDTCLACSTCKMLLSSTTLNDKNGDLFCASCYAKKFGPKGFNIGSHSVYTQ